MKIEIPTNNNYYLIVLTLLSTIPPYSSLSPRERELTANILDMYFSYTNSHDERITLIFSKQGKEELMRRMDIKSLQVLENMLTSLRRDGVLNGNNITPEYIGIDRNKVKEIIFKFK